MKFLKVKIRSCRLKEIAMNLFPASMQYMNTELFGFCPFCEHDLITFCYNYKNDKFHCYNCNASGNIINLWKREQNIEELDIDYHHFCEEFDIRYCQIGPDCKICNFINGMES